MPDTAAVCGAPAPELVAPLVGDEAVTGLGNDACGTPTDVEVTGVLTVVVVGMLTVGVGAGGFTGSVGTVGTVVGGGVGRVGTGGTDGTERVTDVVGSPMPGVAPSA